MKYLTKVTNSTSFWEGLLRFPGFRGFQIEKFKEEIFLIKILNSKYPRQRCSPFYFDLLAYYELRLFDIFESRIFLSYNN